MKEVDTSRFGGLFPTITTLATSVDEKGEPNIITLGWSMKTSGRPPMVIISVAPGRYSHELIERGEEYVLCIPTKEIVRKVHRCGRTSGRDVKKFEEFGLTPLPAKVVKPPLIAECVANLECRVVAKHTTGDHTIFVGEVVVAHVDEKRFDRERRCLDLGQAKVLITLSDEYREAGKPVAKKLDGDVELS